MFAFKIFVSLVLPLLAVATPLVARTDGTQCGVGNTLTCCQTTTTATGDAGSTIFNGSDCKTLGSIIDILGHVIRETCSQQTICCPDSMSNSINVANCGALSL